MAAFFWFVEEYILIQMLHLSCQKYQSTHERPQAVENKAVKVGFFYKYPGVGHIVLKNKRQ